MVFVNKNLISLKCVLFLVFGALGSLLPFLPLHMSYVGLIKEEPVIIALVCPLVAILGPLVACPLADWLAGGSGGSSRSKTGTYLRVMIAICLILATLFYWLLMTVPILNPRPLNVTFLCDEQGGYILQDRCGIDKTCYNWNEKRGPIFVNQCRFTCNTSTPFLEPTTTMRPMYNFSSGPLDDDYPFLDDDLTSSGVQPEYTPDVDGQYEKNYNIVSTLPHMCYFEPNQHKICEVYTEYSRPIRFDLGLKSNEIEEEKCHYSFVDAFNCRIPSDVIKNLTNDGTEDCHPIVRCDIYKPYAEDSLLEASQCGYDALSFWLYLFIRCIADIFPAAAVALLATAVVIATRETSTGRGDVGKQFMFGALGFAIFAPIIGGAFDGKLLAAMVAFTILMALAVCILLIDAKMPLSPPEWWWHTRCGLLALPMSSVRRYRLEVVALAFILLLLGVFWNVIDAFIPWHVGMLTGRPLITGLTITVGALPAILYLYFAERFVDYCGHSNILIFCFANYIIHHIALILTESAELLLICELLEIFTLHIMYVTAVMYLRHLIPRKYTACAQAIPIITHFCLGRFIGILIGGSIYSNAGTNKSEYFESFRSVHKWLAIVAAIVGCLYFALYHFWLKPMCVAPPQVPPTPAPPAFGLNVNGSYTPLRVYHHEKAKKGQFRY